ncbi:MAG: hypothetical protein KW788_02935 [Candidatus Doudnabacteria bacterium]|nr:hypothetical protein [Candidatus Doudnabacteria bacterium]
MCLRRPESQSIGHDTDVTPEQRLTDQRVADGRELQENIQHHRQVAATVSEHRCQTVPADPEGHLGYN